MVIERGRTYGIQANEQKRLLSPVFIYDGFIFGDIVREYEI